MDIDEFLKSGVTIKNPNYKKPTKKDPVGSPKLIQSNNINDAEDRSSRIGGFLAENSYDLTHLNNDENQYAEHNVRINPVNSQDELNQQRAKNQSAMEQTGRFLTQAVVNEIGIGTALGLSNLVDMAVNIGTEKGKDDYTNPFSTYLEDKQDEVKKAFEIYQQNPNESFQIKDFGWWAQNAISIASTLSMLIPSMGITKGLGAVGKFANLERVSMGIAKAAKGARLTKGAYTLSKAINSAAEIGTSALLSRTMEGYQEARGVYKEVYDKSLDKVNTMSAEDKAKLIKANPEFANLSNEEIAGHMSSLSADETFKNDYAMLLMDVVQFKALGSMWKGMANKAETSALRAANKAAIGKLSKDAEEAVVKTGFLNTRKEILQNALKNPLTSIEAIQLSEGVEEAYQGIQTEKGKEVAEKILDPNFSNRNLSSYLTDGHIWEQAFWGALGGIAFQAIGTGLGNASKAIKGQMDKKKLSPEEYALTQMTDEKYREQEINERQVLMQNFASSMQQLNAGKNPFGFKLDPDTKEPLFVDGSEVNEDITADEADQLKIRLTNELVTKMTMNAVDRGNYDLFKDYITDSNFNKFFQEAGLETKAGDTTFSNMLVNKMDEVYENYNQSLYDILNSIDIKNENVAKSVARDIARDKIMVNDLSDKSDELFGRISEESEIDASDYEENERLKYVEARLKEIDKKEAEVQTLLANKRISSQAVEQIIKDNNIRRNQLLAFGSENNMFGNPERIKEILSNSVSDINTNEFITEFNEYLSQVNGTARASEVDAEGNFKIKRFDPANTPKKSVQDIIKKKIELDDHISHINESMPTTQSEYQSAYDQRAMAIDKLTRERYDKAVDIVNEYLESQPDLDVARENVMTNNVPKEIKDQLDILKLGHHSTKAYTSQINSVLSELTKKKEKAAADAKVVVADGTASNGTSAENDIIDIEAVAEQTDDRDDPPSTGEQTEEVKVVPEVVVDDIANLEKQADLVERARADDFLLDTDSRSVPLASTITMGLYKTSRNLFDNLQGKDVNSAEFNRLVDVVEEELKLQGVSRGIARKSAVEGVKLAMANMYRRFTAKGVPGADLFRELADQIATKYKVEVVEAPVVDNTFISKLDKVKSVQQDTVYTPVTRELVNLFRELFNLPAWTGEYKDYLKALDEANAYYASEFSNLLNDTAQAKAKLKELYKTLGKDKATTTSSTTTLIEDGEFSQVIESFIDTYIDNKQILQVTGTKTIINVEDLFKELLSDGDISYEQARHIFFNISDYIRAKNNTKYIFTNKAELVKNLDKPSAYFANLINAKSTTQTLDNHMHVAAPTTLAEGYNKAIANAVAGGVVTVSHTNPKFGYSENSISIQSDGVEIGFLGAVNPNSTNTGYSLRKQNVGFVYSVNSNNGVIESSLDELFIPLINRADNVHSQLLDLAYKQFAIKSARDNGDTSDRLTNEDISKTLSNPAIKNLLAKGLLKYKDKLVTDGQKAAYILDLIDNVIFYDASAISAPAILESYAYWKSNAFNNYKNTHALQTAIKANKVVKTRLVSLSEGKVILDNTNHDVNTRDFTYEQNPVMIVDANGNIINENSNTVYTNSAGFEAGTMGMLVSDNANAPVIALFTEANMLSSNSLLASQVQTELEGLLNKFRSKAINFDELGTALSNLMSGPGVNVSSNLFSGYSVVRTSDRIGLNIQGVKGVYNLIIHKFEKGTNVEGVGMTYLPNGDKEKASSLNINTATIAKEIVSNLKFNKTFYAINNKNVDNEKANPYIYKENGKLVVEIAGAKTVYNSFGHFVLANNAFKTNQGKSANGSYFNQVDKVKSLFIDTAIVNSPVEQTVVQSASDIIKSATKTKGVIASEVLTKVGVTQDVADVLTGKNQFGIELIPKEVYFDDKATKAEAYYAKGKMFFTKKGADNVKGSNKNLVRLLIHEQLHAKFEEQGLFQKAGIVDDLMGTYNALIEAINNDTTSKEAEVIRDWIKSNKFNPIDYFSNLTAEQQREWANRTQEERDALFAEEWLVESLTQPTIIKYLNATPWNGEDVSVEGIDNSAKTIWQKIIDVLLKLFTKGISNIKNNTILAQQYFVLGDRTSVVSSPTIAIPAVSPIDAAPTEETSEVEPADKRTLTPKRERRERSAVTSNIDDAINTDGVQTVPNMDMYVNQFAPQDRALIAKMMATGELNFSCE